MKAMYSHQINVTSAPVSGKQHGVVLIIALIMLVVLSLVAVVTVKSMLSSEVSTNNSRTQLLAQQAAEAALRICEIRVHNALLATPVDPKQTPETAPAAGSTYDWEDVATNWDGTGFTTHNGYILTSSDMNDSNSEKLYKRFPECLIQYLETPAAGTYKFVVTARGFGPDVAALADAAKPVKPTGTEVWLQSTNTYVP